MSWFQRYGIPGAYFVGLLVTGLYAFLYPEIGKDWEPRAVVGLAAIAFLPIGYVISIFMQWRYLRGFGLHRNAMRNLRIPNLGFRGDASAVNEGIIEARTLLLTTLHTSAIPFESNKFIRDWIARRMDVIAINFSIIAANILAAVVFVMLYIRFHSTFHWRWLVVFAPMIISVILIMWLNIVILSRQIVEVIAGLYRRHLNDI